MNQLRPVRHVSAYALNEFLSVPPTPGSIVVPKSQELYAQGFPVRFIQNFHVDSPLAEVHSHEDDVFYCLKGCIRLLTGGRLVEPWTNDGLTFLAKRMEEGKEIILNEGDWLHIPAGQTHQSFTPDLAHLIVIKVTPREGTVQLDYLQHARTLSR